MQEVDASQLTIDPLAFEHELEKHRNKTLKSANLAYHEGGRSTNQSEDNEGEESKNTTAFQRDIYKELSIREMKQLMKQDSLLFPMETSVQSSSVSTIKKKSKQNPFAKPISQKPISSATSTDASTSSSSSLHLQQTTTSKTKTLTPEGSSPYNPFQPPSSIAPLSVKSSEVRSKYQFFDVASADSLTLKQVPFYIYNFYICKHVY